MTRHATQRTSPTGTSSSAVFMESWRPSAWISLSSSCTPQTLSRRSEALQSLGKQAVCDPGHRYTREYFILGMIPQNDSYMCKSFGLFFRLSAESSISLLAAEHTYTHSRTHAHTHTHKHEKEQRIKIYTYLYITMTRSDQGHPNPKRLICGSLLLHQRRYLCERAPRKGLHSRGTDPSRPHVYIA